MPSILRFAASSVQAPAKSSKAFSVTRMIWLLMNSTPSRAPCSGCFSAEKFQDVVVRRLHCFFLSGTLAILAIAQMGVHLVFFLHITTGPDSSHMSWRSRLECSSCSWFSQGRS